MFTHCLLLNNHICQISSGVINQLLLHCLFMKSRTHLGCALKINSYFGWKMLLWRLAQIKFIKKWPPQHEKWRELCVRSVIGSRRAKSNFRTPWTAANSARRITWWWWKKREGALIVSIYFLFPACECFARNIVVKRSVVAVLHVMKPFIIFLFLPSRQLSLF